MWTLGGVKKVATDALGIGIRAGLGAHRRGFPPGTRDPDPTKPGARAGSGIRWHDACSFMGAMDATPDPTSLAYRIATRLSASFAGAGERPIPLPSRSPARTLVDDEEVEPRRPPAPESR